MSWRQFQFFESIPIRDPNFGTASPLYSDPQLTAICPTPSYLIISTNNTLKLIDRDLNLVKSFTAYPQGFTITYLRFIQGTVFIASIAERQGQPSVLKLWNLDRLTSDDDNQKLDENSYHTLVNIKNGNNSYPVTGFTFSSNFNILGVGFANGVVVVIRGDLLRDRGSSQTIAYRSSEPITGIMMVKNNNYDPLIYVTTTSRVLLTPSTKSYQPGSETVLENFKGADMGAIDLEGDDTLIVARSEGIVYYKPDGTTYTVTLEMPKKKVFKSGKYLMIVTSNTSDSSSLLLNGYAEPTKIIIVDTEHKLISFSTTISSTANDIFELWEDVYLLSSDGVLYKIHEKELDQQIDIVVKRDLFPIAIQIAENHVDTSKLLTIRRKYGDYLYDKGETADAMEQYVQTLSLGKTSEIIKKYKDGKEVSNLAKFLEEMLKEGIARKEHVTLLLCAYCKLNDIERLNNFIEKYDEDSNSLVQIEFDLDVVVELCRDINYLDQAANLAKNLGHSSLAVDILVKDLNDTHQALNYIKTLPVNETLRILVEYARTLLDSIPNVTTALLIDIFTGKYKPISKEIGESEKYSTKDETPVLIQSYKAFVNYMSSAANSITGSGADDGFNGNGHSHSHTEEVDEGFRPTYQPPRPRIIFPSFFNKPNQFVIFLEACAQSYDVFEGFEKDKNDILTTLFELYLTIGNDSDNTEVKSRWEKKAIELAKSERNSIDPNAILLISDIFDLHEGQIFANDDGPGFQIDLFRAYVASKNIEGVIDILEKYGDDELELYPLALVFFSSSEEILEEVGEEKFRHVLNKIKKNRILSPLEIIQSLGVNKVATVDLIKDYLVEFIESEKKEIETNQKLISSYANEIESKIGEIHKISNEPVLIQPTKCDSCGDKLDNETTHFLCGHSYHEFCLADENNCPKCTPSREAIHNVRENQKAVTQRNDLFEAALNDSDNKFKTLTDFFGKGAMEKINFKVSDI
jgi:outer membrane lipoprotein-sorting protein